MATTADCSYLLPIAIAIATPAVATAIILHGYSRAIAMATTAAVAWPMMATTIATPAMATAITIILASDGCQYLASTILIDVTTLMISIIILLLVDTSSTG